MGNKEPDIRAIDVIMSLSMGVLKHNPPSKNVYKAAKVVSIAADKAMMKYNLDIDEMVIALLSNLVSAVSVGKLNGDTSRAFEYWENLPEIIFDDETKEETTCH